MKEKKQLWVILTIVFLGFVGISMPYLIFPALFLNPAHLIIPTTWAASTHALFLGVTLAAYPFGQFIGSPILGALSDEYGRKSLLSASLLIAALCYLFSGFAIAWKQLPLLIASRFMAGLMEGNIAIARAMAADLKTLSKHETFGKINAAAAIAYLLGPLLGGVMSEVTTSTPFYFVCLLFICLAALSAATLEKGKAILQEKRQPLWQQINFIRKMATLLSKKRLYVLILTSTIFTLAVDIFYEFGPVYLTVKWALPPAQLTFYNAALCMGLAVGDVWLPPLLERYLSPRQSTLYSIGGASLCLFGISLTDSMTGMMLFFAFMGLCIGLAITLITVKISDAVPDSIQGEVMGAQLSLRVLGDAIICLFGGALLLVSSKLILILAALMCLAVAAYSVRKSYL